MDDYRYQALRTLTRARFDVIQNLTREKQRFANYLFLKCSGIAQDKDIQNTSATTIALVERFETVDDLANADLEELTSFIDEKGRNFADPAAKARAIQTLPEILTATNHCEQLCESGHGRLHCLYAGFREAGQGLGQGY